MSYHNSNSRNRQISTGKEVIETDKVTVQLSAVSGLRYVNILILSLVDKWKLVYSVSLIITIRQSRS